MTDTGTDARGDFTSTTTVTSNDSPTANGNEFSGTDTPSDTSTVITTGTKSGGPAGATYNQTFSDSLTTTELAPGDNNDITGDFTSSTTSTDHYSLTETGSDSNNYTLVEHDYTLTTVTSSGNDISGSDTSTTTASATTTINENGYSGTETFTLTTSTTDSGTNTTTANDITGTYTTSITDSSTSTTHENSTDSPTIASYTETVTDTPTTVEHGNSITGSYTQTITDTTIATDTDIYSNSAGTVTVTEWSSQTATTTMTGNHISSAYNTVTNTTGQDYTMTETGSNFTLTDTGSLSSNGTGSGNTIEGTYNSTVIGTDGYTLQEHGTNLSSQSFSQSITGTDNYTISETGNQANNTYSRGISGSGSYNETSIVASSPTILSGTYSLSNSENADARTGALSQSGLLGRYSLLTYFVDVSNADASSPGNMNFSPVGRAFVDPASGDSEAQPDLPNFVQVQPQSMSPLQRLVQTQVDIELDLRRAQSDVGEYQGLVRTHTNNIAFNVGLIINYGDNPTASAAIAESSRLVAYYQRRLTAAQTSVTRLTALNTQLQNEIARQRRIP